MKTVGYTLETLEDGRLRERSKLSTERNTFLSSLRFDYLGCVVCARSLRNACKWDVELGVVRGTGGEEVVSFFAARRRSNFFFLDCIVLGPYCNNFV